MLSLRKLGHIDVSPKRPEAARLFFITPGTLIILMVAQQMAHKPERRCLLTTKRCYCCCATLTSIPSSAHCAALAPKARPAAPTLLWLEGGMVNQSACAKTARTLACQRAAVPVLF